MQVEEGGGREGSQTRTGGGVRYRWGERWRRGRGLCDTKSGKSPCIIKGEGVT